MLLNTACFTRFTRIGAPVLLFMLLAFLSQRFYFSSLPLRGVPTAAGKLHIGVFATSGNYHLCQLHISAALMGYPAFTLINWQDPEDKDAMKQHAAKIEGAIRYIDSIPADQQDELVFLVDGYDMWFQLPHEYVLKRYHELVAEAHQRHIDEYGQALVKEHKIETTVIFGPDKECAPGGMDAPGCWAVPESLMHPLAFGPETDHTKSTQSRPRWLNSGTIIGPARKIREILIAAAEERRIAHVTDSDQYYFGVLYGMQSYARRLLRLHRDQSLGIDTVGDSAFLDASRPSSPSDKKFPIIADRQSDYSIGLDTNSAIFQTTGFYADYITWVRNNASSGYITDTARRGNHHHHFALQDDLKGRGPGQAVGVHDPALMRWETLPLATNIISRNVPAVMHINGKKGYRILWWPRMWFYPFLEQIWTHLKANSNMGSSTVAGQRRAIEGAHTLNQQGAGWIDWETVCGKYEDRLMGKSREPN